MFQMGKMYLLRSPAKENRKTLLGWLLETKRRPATWAIARAHFWVETQVRISDAAKGPCSESPPVESRAYASLRWVHV